MNEVIHTKRRRRVYFVEKKFQTNFILKFCLLVILGGLLTIGILYSLGAQSTTVSIVNSRVFVRTTADFLLPVLIQTVSAVSILVAVATAILTLLISHKIAGPLYRFKRAMQSLKNGDFLSEFHIRRHDQLQDLAKEFNDMIKKVGPQLSLLRNHLVVLKEKLDGISQNETQENKRVTLDEFKKISDELNKVIQYFKV